MKVLLSVSTLLALATAEAGFLALPITREPVNVTSRNATTKDAIRVASKISGALTGPLMSDVFQYFVSFQLGTPGQTQKASIDTGSSDLWVFGTGTGAPTTYNESASSTAQYVNSGFDISYVDGSGSSGDYYTDEITWGGVTISLQFGLTSQEFNTTNGVFGIATKNAEADLFGVYDNYPYALKDQGVINSVAYSLYLDDINSSTGTLLYGAVDTSRYTGNLQSLPITSSTSFSVNFEVYGHSLNGILDAGTSLTFLPDDIVSSIAASYGATYDSTTGAYKAGSSTDHTLTYTFGSVEVTIPSSELFIELEGAGNGYFLSIFPYSAAQDNILLGDTFLRSAYVVYDLTNNQVAIAQANFNPGTSNYEVISGSTIPGAI